MKKGLLVLSMMLVLASWSVVQAGPNQRTISVFPYIENEMIIPESGAYIQWNDEGGIPYFTWERLTKQEFCEEYPDGLPHGEGFGSLLPPKPQCEKDWEKHCMKEDPQPGHGNEPPWAHGGKKECFNYEEDIVYFKNAASIAYGISGEVIVTENLVVQATLGEMINIRGTIFTKVPKNMKYQWAIMKVWPNIDPLLLWKSNRLPITTVAGINILPEIQYVFDKPGIIRLALRIFKPDGTIGRIYTKIYVIGMVAE